MKHTPSQYAEALYESLEGKSGEAYSTVMKNFLMLLRRNHDYKLLPNILTRYEKIFLKKQGLRKVEVESVSPLSQTTRDDIEAAIGSKVLLDEKHRPDLVAGIRLIIDDSVLIDASARQKIQTIFS